MTTNLPGNPVTPGMEEPQQQVLFAPMLPGQSQNAFTEESEGNGMLTRPDNTASRLFFPTNREDLLLQLGALVISRDFPDGMTFVPVQDEGLALLPDGLRTDEISLLQGGKAGRFPVLVELHEPVRGERDALGISEVAVLCFRSQADADDFRFRPVDEVNTEEMIYRVDPQLFDLPGGARFRNAPEESPELQNRGRFSDRIAGGICSLLELGASWPACWHDIADLLCRPCGAASSQEITLTGALAAGFAPVSDGVPSCSVPQAFIAHATGESASALVARVHARLADGAEDGQRRMAERWFATANAVLQNRTRLDGELLSDEGSVALRAALLGSIVDDVQALITFIQSPRGAGKKVIVAAAFLIGLRTGVAGMPWAMKRSRLGILSSLIVTLRGADPEARDGVGRTFQIEPDETPEGVVLRLFQKDHEIACWQTFEANASLGHEYADRDARSGVEPQSAMQPDAPGGAEASISPDSAAPESGATNCIQGPDGRLIELLRPEPPRQRGVTMRCVLLESDSLRKPKEILEIACTSGLLWRVGVSAEATKALYADLPDWPDDSLLDELSGTLAQALDAYLVKKKVRARTASPRRRKVAGKQSVAQAAQSAVVRGGEGE